MRIYGQRAQVPGSVIIDGNLTVSQASVTLTDAD